MRFDPSHRSRDLIDRRGARPAGAGGAGLVWLLSLILRSKLGWAGVVLAIGAVVAWNYLGGSSDGALEEPAGRTAGETAGDDTMKGFVSFVLDDVQDTWEARLDGRYRRAKLVLFTGQTPSSCGWGAAATGPFYCPSDERVYIDLSFYQALSKRLGAPGDFAQAYVIAHEIGHHVQNLEGTSERVQRASKREREGAEGLSVRLELQADCYAGVWAQATRSRQLLEAGDIEEALAAAAAIGDDRLQKRSGGVVQPETFTHGTSAQRSRWFSRGLEQGRREACDTFAARAL